MKKYLSAGIVLALGLALMFGCSRQDDVAVLNINDIAADPAAFVGTITITGITAGFSQQDRTLFGLMDRKELQCQTPNCNKLILPVRFQGPLPTLGDEVRASGSFIDTGRGYLFTAETVQVLKNHQLGG